MNGSATRERAGTRARPHAGCGLRGSSSDRVRVRTFEPDPRPRRGAADPRLRARTRERGRESDAGRELPRDAALHEPGAASRRAGTRSLRTRRAPRGPTTISRRPASPDNASRSSQPRCRSVATSAKLVQKSAGCLRWTGSRTVIASPPESRNALRARREAAPTPRSPASYARARPEMPRRSRPPDRERGRASR